MIQDGNGCNGEEWKWQELLDQVLVLAPAYDCNIQDDADGGRPAYYSQKLRCAAPFEQRNVDVHAEHPRHHDEGTDQQCCCG